MAIEKIDREKCTGCGICVDACPMDVLRLGKESGKAEIRYVKDCVCCYNCEEDCPPGAVYVDPRRVVQVPPAW
ncbi:MAG: ferredoxin family protein [Synergistaceae bacterium]|jgi:NAD-dependent dihydropyrimidine dehydrogenase PreA subunit|nr:ferredoxin family protein [Synergistaceae bacterium]